MVEDAKFALHGTMIIFSAVIDAVRLLHIGDQLGLTCHIGFDLCVGSAHAVWVVGVAAAKHRQSVLHGKLARIRVGFWGFTGVERLHKVKMFHEAGRVFLVGARARDAQMTLSAWMCRPEDSAVSVHDIL